MRKDVEEALKKYGVTVFGNKKNIEKAEEKLWDEETVFYVEPTNAVIYSVNIKDKQKLPGVFFVTNKRVLFCSKTGLSETMETFALSEIKSVNSSGNSLTGGHISVHTMTKTLDILVTYKKKVMQEIVDMINKVVYDYNNSTNEAGSNNNLQQIEKLYELYEKGILSKEEFETKKKKLLE